MVRGIWVEPDKGKSRVLQVARFTVPADMPEAYVRELAYPAACKEWLEAFAKRGYDLCSRVYLFPKSYAHMPLPDSGAIGAGSYEHDPTQRMLVDRRMTAYFIVRDVVVEVLPESEKQAIRDYYRQQERIRVH